MARNILRSTEAAMPFGEIAKRLGISEANASLICSRALRKLRRSPACMDALWELQEYHSQLRARSAECLAAQEGR